MKFILKECEIRPGETRTIRRFLVWPRRIGPEIRWLEWVAIEQQYQSGPDGRDWYWFDLQFRDGPIATARS